MKLFALALFLIPAFNSSAYPLNGPGRSGRKDPVTAAKTLLPIPAPGLCIFGGQSGKIFGDLAAFKSVIWKNDVIYLGGDSGRLKDRQARLEALKALREARGSRLAVGFDAFDQSLQPVLDDYAAGRMKEEEFLQKIAWQKRPGSDFSLYRPVFDFIIQNKLRALALNTPDELVFKIERDGLAGLTSTERGPLPEQIAISKHRKYLELLKTSFGGMSAAATGAVAWDNYLASVSAWNEAAGARIADFMTVNPGWAVLVMAGNDRVIYNAAIPASVKSRLNKPRQASFYIEAAVKCPAVFPKEHKDLANYIWYVDSSTATETGAP